MAQFCSQCGAALKEGQVFCSYCGAKTNNTPPQPVQPQQPIAPQQPAQSAPYGGQPNYSQPYFNNQPQYTPLTQTEEMPMKWFKFIIYFQLFAAFVLGIGNGILTLTGMQYDMYGSSAKDVYRIFPDMEIFDMCYGIMMIAIGVFALFVRSPLKNFRKNGPNLYYIFLGANIVASLIYIVGSEIAISQSRYSSYVDFDSSSTFSSIAVSCALLACNIGYFKKRMHLFTK